MPSQPAAQISENSRRIARNTLLLYFRMLLMMFIGLFTSRVVLKVLGIEDAGIYNAVGGVVTVFTFITASISSAISRFMNFELGRGDMARLRRVFSTSVLIQLMLAALIVILVETAGVWHLEHRMKIPEGRMDAARLVLHCSLGVLVINLLSVPFNAVIIAREKMSAFAAISILEAVLKLAVALLLYVSVLDKLETYAVLMLAVALIIRFTYGAYCHRHFEESRGKLVFDAGLLKEMSGMAGWSFFGSSAMVFNTQGVNLAVNWFFGVAMNTARGVALQVEGIVKQFVTNFLTALNPQIIKSYASGDRGYCFELVSKGIKYSALVVLLFAVPVLFEADLLLDIWLYEVPASAASFVRLTMLVLMVDIVSNPLVTLAQATGDVRKYYLITGFVSYSCLPLVLLAFKLGASAGWAYVIFVAVYAVVFGLKLALMKRQTGFPVGTFFKEVVLKLLPVTALSLILPLLLCILMNDGWLRLLLVLISSTASLAAATYCFALTDGERRFFFDKICRFLPDRLFLKWKYRLVFGSRLDLRSPETFSGIIQWQKLYDRNPLYHTLVDKAEVKKYVAEKIGEEYVIPTLGVWDSVEEIDWDALPMQFVLKCTHDSGSAIICRDKAKFGREEACARLSAAMKKDFYRRDREWAYKGLQPRIIAEQFLGPDVSDYKFFCSDGKVRFLFIATERASTVDETKFDFFDADFNHLDVRNGHPNAAVTPPRPEHFELMKTLAGKLSEGMRQVRIDFYEVGSQVYFGEYTFYHWSGFMPYDPPEWDVRFGKMLNS